MLKSIFYEIKREMSQAEIQQTPISDLVRKKGFNQINKQGLGEVYRSELRDVDSYIIASIVSVEHDRIIKHTPDTYHNYLEYYENGILVEKTEYMY